MGVNFTDATLEGLVALYEHGEAKGKEFIAHHFTVTQI